MTTPSSAAALLSAHPPPRWVRKMNTHAQNMKYSKADILSKIKEFVEENNNRIPGSKAFQNFFNIRQLDWQLHFDTWADAIKAAGFEPNQFSKRSGDESVILHLIQLARELGRFPKQIQCRKKAQIGKSFPSLNVIYKTFAKDQYTRIKKVRDYCKENGGYDDILSMLPALTETDSGDNTSQNQDQRAGFVYLLRHGSSRREYKIGKTFDELRRHGEIRLQMPESITNIHTIKTDDPSGIEAYWHKRFSSKRKNGEWFVLNQSDVEAFKRWKNIF